MNAQEPAVDSAVITQSPDTLQTDTARAISAESPRAVSDYPNPKKAALYSLIPGGGQIYNKKYWWIKVPVIYGGLISSVIVLDFNTDQYKAFKKAYIAELNGEPHEFSDSPRLSDPAVLKLLRDIYDKRRQEWILATSAIYLANILEAYVSAHLLNFDISEDLSLRVQPVHKHSPAGSLTGIGVVMYLK